MQDYLTSIRSAIFEIKKILPNINLSNKESLFSLVRDSNKLIVSAYVKSFPQQSLSSIVSYYLSNYRYSCIRCECHPQTKTYNIKLASAILPFSAIAQSCPILFQFSDESRRLNDTLFYAIMQKDGSPSNQEQVVRELSRVIYQNRDQLSISFLDIALRQYLSLISNNDLEFVKIYGKRRNIRLINQQILISKCKSFSDIYKIGSSCYKEIPPSNILYLLIDALVRELENSEKANHKITRHPAWCYHNIYGNGKCKELNIVCHTTVGCPFFQKAEQLPSGAIHLY